MRSLLEYYGEFFAADSVGDVGAGVNVGDGRVLAQVNGSQLDLADAYSTGDSMQKCCVPRLHVP